MKSTPKALKVIDFHGHFLSVLPCNNTHMKTKPPKSTAPTSGAPRLTKARLRSVIQDGFSDPEWAKKVLAEREQGVLATEGVIGLRLCVLASGSDGNCLCVTSGQTVVLIDAGITLSRLTEGLAQIGIDPKAIRAVLLTHDHSDHWASATLALHQRYGVPIYANEGTAEAVDQIIGTGKVLWRIFETGSQFTIGDLAIEPFTVPHDAAETVGFVLDDGQCRLGIATDLGMATETVRRALANCNALVLEANHDVEMLRHSARPRPLIRRIEGCRGHLSNEQSAALLGKVISPRLKTVTLAHLSRECNTPALATAVVKQVLEKAGRTDVRVGVAGGETTVFIVISGLGPADAQPGK